MDVRAEKINRKIEGLIQEFEREAQQAISDQIKRNDISASGDLLRSLKSSYKSQNDTVKLSASQRFLEYGKIQESSKKYIQNASGKALQEYIKDKGLDKFEFIPGYKRVPSRDIALRRMSFAMTQLNKRNSRRPRKIKTLSYPFLIYRPYFGLWKDYRIQIVELIFDNVTEDVFDTVVNDLKESTKNTALKFK